MHDFSQHIIRLDKLNFVIEKPYIKTQDNTIFSTNETECKAQVKLFMLSAREKQKYFYNQHDKSLEYILIDILKSDLCFQL